MFGITFVLIGFIVWMYLLYHTFKMLYARSREIIPWFLLAIVTGPIGTIIIMIFLYVTGPSNKKPKNRQD